MLIIFLYLTFVFFFVNRHRLTGQSSPARRHDPSTRRHHQDDDDEDEQITGRSAFEDEDVCLTGAHHGVYDGPDDSYDSW